MIRDQIKTATNLLYKKAVKGRLKTGVSSRKEEDTFEFSWGGIHSSRVGLMDFTPRENTIRLRVPFGEYVLHFQYSYPANLVSIKELFDEFLFELFVLKGNTTDEVLSDLGEYTDDIKEVLSQLDKPVQPRKEALEIKEGIKSLLDQIEQEHGLQRFQARTAFANIFPGGVPFSRKEGALVEEAIKRVRDYMTDERVEEFSSLEAPFSGTIHAPINPRAAAPGNSNWGDLQTLDMEFQAWREQRQEEHEEQEEQEGE